MTELESDSPEETERLAGRLAAELAPGDVVLVQGELGSGKTTFVRGAARALGRDKTVRHPETTPTFYYALAVDALVTPESASAAQVEAGVRGR